MRTLKYALRALARTPVLTAVAVFSLALGFGANAAISSLFRQVLLRPLPVPQADRLINLGGPGDREGHVSCSNAGACDAVFSYPMFRDLAQAPAARTGVSGIAAHRGFDANLAARGQTLSGRGELVSGSYFPVLGLTPSLGRLLDPTDDRPGGPPVAVLTNAYWRTQLGADSAVVGRTILVNGHPTIVVGVAPRGFTGTTFDDHPQLFVPITLRPLLTNANDTLTNRRDYWVYLFARLAPGVTAEQARRGLNAVYRPILRDVEAPLQGGITPAALARFRDRVLTVEPGARGQTRLHADARTPLGLLLLTSGVVLLIACANVANLLLVRGAARAGEMALRLALGATRQRLLALLLTESLVLAVAGAVVGLVVARWTLGGLARLLPSDVGGTVHVALDPWMFATTAALALSTGVVFGLFPAVQATRVDLARPIRGGAGQVAGSSRGAARFRLSLVAGQIALSMTLLVSAGLFVRSLVNITRERLGVNVERVVTFALAPGRNAYSGQRSRMLFQQVEQALAAMPGVTGVTGARVGLLRGTEVGANVSVSGFHAGPGTDTDAMINWVEPGFFHALGTPLLGGREFSDADRVGTPKVVVVNEAFVRKFGLGRAAVGKRMAKGGGNGVQLDREIVGVVQDAKYSEVKGPVPPVFFVPAQQDTTIGSMVFYARTALAPEALLRAVPGIVRQLDPALPVEDLRTLSAQAREDTSTDRLVSTLAIAFAGLATVLAAVGLYGVLSYMVAQRTRELGVRVALGASAAAVRGLVLGQVGRLVLVGGAVGLMAALALGRAARSLLYGLSGTDPVAIAGAAAVLAAVGAVAGYLPARRAARVNPMEALRNQ